MTEIADDTIDLIVTSPPYNIGTDYGDYDDNLLPDDYIMLLDRVFKEMSRVCRAKGKTILETADSVFSNGKYIQLARMMQHKALSVGYYLENRHINFVQTDGITEPPIPRSNEDKKYSNCHQILIFSKAKPKKRYEGKVLYHKVIEEEGHRCPANRRLLEIYLNSYFNEGYNVLDPFMGTGRLGEMVLQRRGNFFGYEIVQKHFEVAQRRLKNTLSKLNSTKNWPG